MRMYFTRKYDEIFHLLFLIFSLHVYSSFNDYYRHHRRERILLSELRNGSKPNVASSARPSICASWVSDSVVNIMGWFLIGKLWCPFLETSKKLPQNLGGWVEAQRKKIKWSTRKPVIMMFLWIFFCLVVATAPPPPSSSSFVLSFAPAMIIDLTHVIILCVTCEGKWRSSRVTTLREYCMVVLNDDQPVLFFLS